MVIQLTKEIQEFYTSVSISGDNILYRGYRDGHPYKAKVPFKPKFYIKSKNKDEQKFVSMFGDKLAEMKFESIRDAKSFMKEYKDIDVDIFGMPDYKCQFLQAAFPNELSPNFNLINICSLDIETHHEHGFPDTVTTLDEITAIGLHTTRDDVMHVWTTAKYDKCKFKYSDKYYAFDYNYFDGPNAEVDLLKAYLAWWKEPINTPDVITGWNCRGFDVPYIVNRIYKVLGETDKYVCNKLSPWKQGPREVTYTTKMGKREAFEIPGIEIIDYMDLFMKFGVLTYGPQPSFKLDAIAGVVLGTAKEKFNGTLDELYASDPHSYIDYNIKDVDIIVDFEKEMGLIALSFNIAYKAGVNPSETMGTTNVWESIVYRFCQTMGVIVPPKKPKSKTPYPGGYCKPPIPNFYKWITSFDLASLYPHIFLQFNMSPETILDWDRFDTDIKTADHIIANDDWPSFEEGISTAANGVKFNNKVRGIFPQIIEKFYAERKIAKGKMLEASKLIEAGGLSDVEIRKLTIIRVIENNIQMAIKILMNSLYGACGTPYFTYFNQDIAEAITLSGQLAIKVAEKSINDNMNKLLNTDIDYVIAIDTDSCYVNMEPLVNIVAKGKPILEIVDVLDNISEQSFVPAIEKSYEYMAEKLGVYENKMVMEREAISDIGIWTSKKHYMLRVYDNEGVKYNPPKLKIMGLEAVKSSTPIICKDKFKKVFAIILDQDKEKMQSFVADFKVEFNKLEPHEVAFPRSVNNMEKYEGVTKRLPINVRASQTYNKMLIEHNLTDKYEKIQSGNKIKYSYCKMPNPAKQNVIAFTNDELPEGMGMDMYIDYDKQFQKSFADPLEIVLDAIGWSIEEQGSLESLF